MNETHTSLLQQLYSEIKSGKLILNIKMYVNSTIDIIINRYNTTIVVYYI